MEEKKRNGKNNYSRKITSDYSEKLISYNEIEKEENFADMNIEKVIQNRDTFKVDSNNLIKSLFSQIKRNSREAEINRSTFFIKERKNNPKSIERIDYNNSYRILKIFNFLTFLIEVFSALFSIIFFKNSMFSPRVKAIYLNIGVIAFWGFWMIIFLLTFLYSIYPLLFPKKLTFIEFIVIRDIGFWNLLAGLLWSGWIIVSGFIKFNKYILIIFLFLSLCLKSIIN